MNREQFEEFAALRALGLLEPEQEAALQAHLREHPQDRELLHEFANTAADLALSVPQVAPSPALKKRVLDALPERRPQPREATATTPAPATAGAASKVVAFRWVPWAIAACLALACGLLVQSNLKLRTEVANLEQQSALDDLQIAVLSSLLQNTPDARAVCVWDEDRQEGVLTVENLPPVPADRDYQLWVVDPAYGDPVDGGVFNTSADGSLRFPFHPGQTISAANAFAVSLERKGGVPKAEGPMVLITKQ